MTDIMEIVKDAEDILRDAYKFPVSVTGKGTIIKQNTPIPVITVLKQLQEKRKCQI